MSRHMETTILCAVCAELVLRRIHDHLPRHRRKEPEDLDGYVQRLRRHPGAMLVLAFTMVGSTLQLPGVGGGSQVASFLAYTVVFGVEKEPAAAASIVLWLVTFAASSLAGVPLLIKEGFSMRELSRIAREEEEAAEAGAATAPVDQGDLSR